MYILWVSFSGFDSNIHCVLLISICSWAHPFFKIYERLVMLGLLNFLCEHVVREVDGNV